MKASVHHLIILDESGSMQPLTKATIDGCNETINTIISAQQQHADTQEHFCSIYVFQNGTNVPSRYIIRNIPAGELRHITFEDYTPWGNTPLYDAIGFSLANLREEVRVKELGVGSVTIITDGMENSSEHYSREQVAKMIDVLTELGWNFNFIGANIDASSVAQSLNIGNAMQFQATDTDTRRMHRDLNNARRKYFERLDRACEEDNYSAEMPMSTRLKSAARNFFTDLNKED